jgi:hypothetical protein
MRLHHFFLLLPNGQACDVAMAKQLLHGTDVAAVFEQVRGERVAERVGSGSLGDPGAARRIFHDALEHGLVEVMPPPLTCLAVVVDDRPDGGRAGERLLGARGHALDDPADFAVPVLDRSDHEAGAPG